MVTMIFFFLGLLLTALGLGPAFSHVLEMPGKRRLSPTVWLAVQQTLFTSFGRTLGIVESAAFATRPEPSLCAIYDRKPVILNLANYGEW
jgi:hypothetical protein